MRRFRGAAVICAMLLLTACADLIARKAVDITLYELQTALSHHFPFSYRYMELFDVEVTNPRLMLQPGTDRVVTSFDTLVSPPFMQKSWNGALSISGGLRFDPARNALMLSNPRVENFNFKDLDPSYARQVEKIGSALAEKLAKEAPLYIFNPDQLRRGGMSVIPSQINTRPGGLVVTFEPVK